MIRFECIRNNKLGFLSESGQTVVPPKYELSYYPYFTNHLGHVCMDGLYGLVNMDGKEVVPPISEEAISVYDGQHLSLFLIKKGKCWGVYDAELGAIAVPAIYENIRPFSETSGYTAARLDGRYGFISREGVMASDFRYEEASSFQSGLAIVRKDGKYGLMDHNLNLKSPMIYEYMDFLRNGLIRIEFKGKCGCLSRKGTLVIPPRYKGMGISTKNLVELIDENGKFFVFDADGKPYPETLARSVYYIDGSYRFFKSGMARAENNGAWGYVGYDGNLAVDYRYEDADEFNGEFAAVKLGGKWGVISKKGEMIVPPAFDRIYVENYSFKVAYGSFSDDGYCSRFFGKWGLMNLGGQLIYPAELDSEYDIREVGNGIIAVKVDGKWGLINDRGDIISLPVFDGPGVSKGNYVNVTMEKKEGVIDIHGEYVISPVYAAVKLLTGRYAAISEDARHYEVVDLETGEKDDAVYYGVDSMLYDDSAFKLHDGKGWRLYYALRTPVSDYFDDIRSVSIYRDMDTDD